MAAASSYDKVARNEAAKESTGASADRAAFRAYNNYFKSAQIRFALSSQLWTPANRPRGIAYLDLASGRGGDLAKILIHDKTNQAVPVTTYTALDISADSVAEAKRRYETMAANPRLVVGGGDGGGGLRATIDVANVFDTDGAWKTHPALAACRYDVVGMQFALHYGCSSAGALGAFLKCVSDVLVEGGYFIGTTVDYTNGLRKKITKQQQQEKTETSPKSTSLFQVTLLHPEIDVSKLLLTSASSSSTEQQQQQLQQECIGIPYRFELDELVDDVEFSVPWEVLKAEAAKVGLVAVEAECGNLYADRFKARYIPSATDLKRPLLSNEDIELISFYIGFAFVKKSI